MPILKAIVKFRLAKLFHEMAIVRLPGNGSTAELDKVRARQISQSRSRVRKVSRKLRRLATFGNHHEVYRPRFSREQIHLIRVLVEAPDKSYSWQQTHDAFIAKQITIRISLTDPANSETFNGLRKKLIRYDERLSSAS